MFTDLLNSWLFCLGGFFSWIFKIYSNNFLKKKEGGNLSINWHIHHITFLSNQNEMKYNKKNGIKMNRGKKYHQKSLRFDRIEIHHVWTWNELLVLALQSKSIKIEFSMNFTGSNKIKTHTDLLFYTWNTWNWIQWTLQIDF